MKVPTLFNAQQWLKLGTDLEGGETVSMLLDRLTTHLHIIGPPGSGKTRFLLSLFQQLCDIPNSAIVLFNIKGDLGINARDWSISHGHTRRLIWFDPTENQNILGYNPLSPNGLPIASHAKNVREAIKSAWGQTTFDQTAQLARVLFLALFVARELTLTLTEALALLRPESDTRRAILPAIADPYIREELTYIDGLRPSRQDELLAPTLARLQSFVLDPTIRRVITQQSHSLDLAEVLDERKIMIVNFEQQKPLGIDDVKLLSRFIINDLLAHVFNRPSGKRTHLFLLIDEAQNFCTADLSRALAQGRELGLSCALAHHDLGQLQNEDPSGLLLDSVMSCARTKVLFGGLSTSDLEVLVPEVAIDQFDPWRIKDEITSLELEPIESQRMVSTQGGSFGRTLTISEERSRGISRAFTKARSKNYTQGEGLTIGEARAENWGTTESLSEGHSRASGTVLTNGRAKSSGRTSGSTTFESAGETLLPAIPGVFGDGSEVISTSVQEGEAQSSSASEMDMDSESESYIENESNTKTHGRAWHESETAQESRAESHTEAWTEGETDSFTEGQQDTRSRGRSDATNRVKNWSTAVTPFYEYKKRRVVTSRQFLNKEEQLTLILQRIKGLPQKHFALKVPEHPLALVRAPFVEAPWISETTRSRALARVYQQRYYGTPEAIEREESQRANDIKRLGYNEEVVRELPAAEAEKPVVEKKPTPRRTKRQGPATKAAPTLFDSINLTEDDSSDRER